MVRFNIDRIDKNTDFCFIELIIDKLDTEIGYSQFLFIDIFVNCIIYFINITFILIYFHYNFVAFLKVLMLNNTNI